MTDGEKMREEYHRKYIDYIGIGITQVSYWRRLLFENDYGKKFLISQKSMDDIPVDLQEFFLQYDLRFYVSKVTESECPEDFDGLLSISSLELINSSVACHLIVSIFSSNFSTIDPIIEHEDRKHMTKIKNTILKTLRNLFLLL